MKTELINIINYYIQTFTYSFEAAYDSSHEKIDNTVIFHYGQEFSDSPFEVVPYQSIVFAVDETPEEISRIINSYKFKGDGSFAIQVFHEELNPQKYKMRYQPLGYEYFLPNILQLANLPTSFEKPDIAVHQITKPDQANFINNTFSNFKPFPKKVIGSAGSMAFYAEIDKQAAGWSYLIRKNNHTAYVAGMFTQPEFRQKGVSTAMLYEIHRCVSEMGIRKMILVPSFMAWNFYTKRGYDTIAHFSTFLPSEKAKLELVRS